ncbi:hypothetical protein PENSOL_c001G03409 [Penicillium solitum]|uniref:N-acetyltransferase domain-containing protein n=1 Tax=Penicillium solitum TaxID=60172 RepID=A0A1V6RS04_9EURO|nr:uncharacterized protein PENSOL_c001G03409 [Penicillium solitum]OQE04274.1 hypothetical protein PENSOL_c001G03409 [Penicillium solitum]
MVVHYNPLTKEPYLQLPAPCANIIITPYREHQIVETSAVMTEILNDSRVYSWLVGPPYPFLPEHGVDWVKMKIAENKNILSTLQREFETSQSQPGRSSDDKEEPEFFDKCPLICIRKVTERDPATGAPLRDVLIGEISLTRYSFYELRPDSPELALAQKQNNDLPAGHKDIVWDYLSPTQQSRGVMSVAVRTVIQDWGIPRMNLHHLKSSFFVGNTGSSRVLEKNNFVEIGTFKDWTPASPNKGRGRMSIVVVEWKGLL